MTFSFNNNASGMNAGEIEFNGPSFTPASTTNQKITNAAWGNKFVFDGANFSGDTFNYAGTTLTVKSGASTILTMNNLSGTSLTSASFVGVGDAIQVVCYAAGILTATGERIVESLSAGRHRPHPIGRRTGRAAREVDRPAADRPDRASAARDGGAHPHPAGRVRRQHAAQRSAGLAGPCDLC